MRITIIGRGRVGGGLARLFRAAGHEVDALGRDGRDPFFYRIGGPADI